MRLLASKPNACWPLATDRQHVLALGRAVVTLWRGGQQLIERKERSSRWLLLVVTVLPGRVTPDRVVLGLPLQQVIRSEAGRADDRNGLLHKVWIGHHPLERLHAAHGDSHDCPHTFQVKDLRDQFVLAIHHIADGDLRESHARLLPAVRWGCGDAVTQRIDRDDEVDRRVDQLPGSQHELEIRGGPAEPRWNKNGI